jgi:hypothetical protein
MMGGFMLKLYKINYDNYFIGMIESSLSPEEVNEIGVQLVKRVIEESDSDDALDYINTWIEEIQITDPSAKKFTLDDILDGIFNFHS